VIFLVSVQFVSHSIESWFNVPVEEALESGINLSRAGLDRAVGELTVVANRTVQELADRPFGTERATLAAVVRARPACRTPSSSTPKAGWW
jgi:nitrogen fixation/metabolism regulation signal transduction histidine kinase